MSDSKKPVKRIPKLGRQPGPRRLPDKFVRRMWREYSAGASLSQVGRNHGRNRSCIRELLESRGFEIRPNIWQNRAPRSANGCYLKATPKTAAEIEGMIARLQRVEVPEDLKHEWRLWPLDRRMDFIRRAKERFPSTRPKGPFSANLIPFDYGTPRAREIVKRLNRGLDSRHKKAQIKPTCEGVIWEGTLFYWCENTGGGYFIGTWKEGRGRPALHHIIWERTNGRKVPASFTVVCADGNKNNLDPSNLVLRSRAECARQNMCEWRRRQSRDLTAVLLRAHQKKGNDHGHINAINGAVRNSNSKRGYARGEAGGAGRAAGVV